MHLRFSSADLARVTLADAPDRRWELLLSLWVLAAPERTPMFEPWQRRIRLTTELRELAARRSPPQEWTAAMRAYFHDALEPYWPRIEKRARDDHAERTSALVAAGAEALLKGLHPSLRWRAPVLELRGSRDSGEYRLGGRGLRLVPSLFCQEAPRIVTDLAGHVVLLYPLAPDPGWAGERSSRPKSANATLGALLGPTRAQVLEATEAGCTTTELGRLTGISVAAASYHASILREAGLIETHRRGMAVQHNVTALGAQLLAGATPEQRPAAADAEH
jgi:DNA-binding MarR family transcriptional regulator